MQIALVAAVLFAGMWFTVLRPKSSDSGSSAPTAPAQSTGNVAPGVKGLSNAVAKAQGASATSDAANANVQKASAAASGETPAAKPATPAAATKAPAKSAAATKSATAKAAPVKKVPAAKAVTPAKKPAATTAVDPSTRLLAQLAKGKVVVLLFHSDGADDRAAEQAVRRLAASDKKVVVSTPSIAKVGQYQAITRGVQVLAAPTILVIGKDHKAETVSGYTDVNVLRQMVGDARRDSRSASKKSK